MTVSATFIGKTMRMSHSAPRLEPFFGKLYQDFRVGAFARSAWMASACTLLALACACEEKVPEPEGKQASLSAHAEKLQPVASPEKEAATEGSVGRSEKSTAQVEVLLQLNESAYGKTLAVDEDTTYLLTQDAAYRLSPAKAPVRVPLDLGYGPAFTDTSIVFWSKGTLMAAPKKGGGSRPLGSVARRPLQIVASGDRTAWLDKDGSGGFSIQTLKQKKSLTLYKASSTVSSLAMLQDWVFFVERGAGNDFRIGRVSVNEGKAAFSPIKEGRVPSMLAGSKDGIFYFDLPSRSLLRLSPDFQKETVVAKGLVCSPLSVSDRILCGRVEGVFEVPLDGGKVRKLTTEALGLVTSIAGSSKRVAWLNDSGSEGLTLRSVSLTPGESH